MIGTLLDKDMGQIAAVQEAWSWTTNIQLCLWHIERAIDRKINEKKKITNLRNTQFSAQGRQTINLTLSVRTGFLQEGEIPYVEEEAKAVKDSIRNIQYFTR